MAPDSGHSHQRRRAVVVLLALALSLALSACATIPTGGAVHQGRDLAQEPDPQLPRSLGRDPAPGDGPEAIVRGFLQSGADFLDDHKYAREYLAPAVRSRWNPSKGTSIYDRSQGLSVVVQPGSSSAVVESTEVARIDADGRYYRVPERTATRQFGLARVSGQWRITKVDNGLLLSSSDVDTAYRQVNLYFLAPTNHVVVPDPVLLPDVPGLTTKLMTRLLQGPTEPLRGARRVGLPAGHPARGGVGPGARTGWRRSRLDAGALRGDPDARVGMSAQIVWTLRQLQDIRRIRILADGDDLVTSGVPREQPTSAWASYRPRHPRRVVVALRRARRPRRPAGREDVHAGARRGGHRAHQPRPRVAASGHLARRQSHRGDEREGNRALRSARSRPDAPLKVVPLEAGAERLDIELGLQPRPVVRRPDDEPPADVRRGRLPPVDRADAQDLRGAAAVRPGVARRDPHRVRGRSGGGQPLLPRLDRARGRTAACRRSPACTRSCPTCRACATSPWIDADTLVVVGNRADEPPVALRTDTDGLDVDDSIDPLRGIAAMVGAPTDSKLPLVASTDAGQLQQWNPSLAGSRSGIGRDPVYPG